MNNWYSDPTSMRTNQRGALRRCGGIASLMLLMLGLSPAHATTVTVASCPWTTPANVTAVTAQVWGGGGAGGGNTTTSDGGGGGGGGAFATATGIAVSGSVACTIGAGGTGVTGAAGNAGGQTWFNAIGTVLANGGGGGQPPVAGAGGVGGTAGSVGAGTGFSGGTGGYGRNNGTGRGGPGGSSAGTAANGTSGPNPYSTTTAAAPPAGGGIGGNGGATGANGLAPASGNGGGGGGSGDRTGANRTGGAGAAGKIVLTYKTNQTITVGTPAPASAAYNSQFTVAATASSGLTVAYSSGSPAVCTNIGATFTMVAPTGTCVVQYDQAGDANDWNAAPQVTNNVTATKADQTISFGAQAAQTYAPSGTFAISPLATASSGLAITYTSTTLSVCTIAGTTVTIVTAGTCTIAADQAGDTNYNAAPQATQNITINPANQTISFGAQAAQTYVPSGTFAISPLATATSGLAVTYTSTTLSVCTVAGTTVTIVTTGTCTIAANQAGNTNYNAAPQVTQNVLINPGAANKLAFIQQPSNSTVDAPITPAITVQIQDFYGNLITSDGRIVTLSQSCGPGFGGTPSVAAVAGVATFADLSLDDIVTACQLTATSSPALTPATSVSFDVTFLPASQLVFANQPNNEGPNTTMSPAITVEVQNSAGQIVTTSTALVTLAIGTNPGGGTLGGTVAVNAVAGTATFSDLSINNTGNGYTLTATSAPLSADTSNPFNIVATTASFGASGTWTAPPGVTSVTIEAWGGGGAGGSATGNPAKGGGGAGGQYAKKVVAVTPGTNYAYVVGAGGTGGGGAGPSGGDTTFAATTVVAKGGAGGASGTTNGGTALGGVGSATSGIGDTVYRGGSGSNGVGATQPAGVGGAGGGGAGSTGAGGDANPSATTAGTGTAIGGGAGAPGRTTSGTCTAGATIAGGGGCGGYALSNTNRNGGSGARGRIDITYVPATVLADGTNPSNVTLAPGAGITDLDAFTLVTSTTTDSVTALTVTLSGVNPEDSLSEVRITNNAGTTTYFTAVTNPGSNTINFSGGTPITATTTVTTYKVRITPKTHANMPLPPGASYAVGGTVTAFTSSRAQTLTDSASATVTIDNLSPASATATSGTTGDTIVTLNWTTSSSADFSRSVMLRWAAGSVGFEVPAEGTDYANGNTIGTATVACMRTGDTASAAVSGVDGAGTGNCSATPLTNGQAYSYRIFQKDSNGNYDQGSTVGSFTPAAPVATKLAFFQQPSNTAAGVPISPAITVQIQDASSNVVTSDTRTISLAKSCGGNFGGTTSIAAVAGVATFSSVSIDTVAIGCQLTASSSPVLTPATSVAFDITTAPLCFTDDFNRANGSPGSNWSVGFKTGTFGSPVILSNRLRLTDATGGASTWATLQRMIPAAGNMVTVIFDYYAYGGTHADGVAVILSDASVAPAAGAFGGSLGYAQKGYTPVSDCTTPGGCPGFAGGWLGTALDEYGNFSVNGEGRYGGVAAVVPNSVAIRGSGTGMSGYRFLQGTNTLSPAVDAVAAPPHRYRIVVDHTDGVHVWSSVERDATSGGTAYTKLIGCPPGVTIGCTALDVKDPGYSQNPIPTSFNLSLTGSTGGANNVHEIDNLSVCTAQPLVPPSLHHVRIEHGGTACTSNPATVTVKACADANCTSLYMNSVTVDLTPNAGGGRTWTPAEPITFSGGATTLTLGNTAAGSVTLGGSATAPTTGNATRCFNGATETCTLTYAVCTFDVVEVGAAANTPIFTKLAATPFNLSVLSLSGAAQTANAVALVDASSGSCGSYPVLGNTSTAVPSSFTGNQVKTFSFNYANAASNVRVRVTDATAAVSCSSDNFAIRPLSLVVSSDATQTGNTGTPVFRAGTDGFSIVATTTATNLYNGTPKVNSALVTSGQANPGILTPPTLTAAVGGVSTTSGFKWSEVGNINLAAIAVYDDTFANVDSVNGECTSDIATNNTIDGNGKFGCMFYSAAVGPFGRFIPAYLKTEFNTTQPCNTFTYSGQPFRIKVTAMSTTGPTLNYTGSFAKAVDLGSDGASCTPTTTNFSNVTPSPTLAAASFTSGVASTPAVTSAAPLPVSYAQALAAPATVNVCAKDADGVNSHGQTQAALAIRNGRLTLSNKFGSEKADMLMEVQAQYWTGLSWVLNVDDKQVYTNDPLYPTCTGTILTNAGAAAVYLSGYVAPLTAITSAGFSANGDGKWLLTLLKPSPVKTGSVNVAINLGNSGVDQSCLAAHGGTGASMTWLRSLNGSCAVTYDRDPSAKATFGVYSPETRKTVHIRELY